MPRKRADARSMAKKGKRPRGLGPATVAKPALFGAAALFVVQTAMKVFLHA